MAKIFKVRRFYVAEEATFPVDPDSGGATYKPLLTRGGMFKPAVGIIERDVQNDDLTSQDHLPGAKGGSVSFQLELRGSGTPAVSAVPSIAAEADLILKNAFGTVVRGTGTTLSAGAAAGAATFTVTSAAGLQKGMMIALQGAGGVDVRFVAGISGTTITPNAVLTYAHAISDVVVASSLYRPALTGMKSLALVGDIDGALWTFLGCIIEKISFAGLSVAGIPLLDVAFKVGTYVKGGKGSLPSMITTWPAPPVGKAAPGFIDNATKLLSEFSFDPGLSYQHEETMGNDDNKSGFHLANRDPKGSMKAYYEDADFTKYEAATVFSTGCIVGSSGTAAGTARGIGIYIPRAQLIDFGLEDKNGGLGASLSFKARDNGLDPDFVACLF